MHQTIKRTFIPGDEWLYIKIYTGYKTADMVLTKVLPSVIANLENKKIIDKWFFIRYSDPQFHLRVRFKLNNVQNISSIIAIFNKRISTYVARNLVWKVQIDTYQRELERYGNTTIGYAEDIFHFDSKAIIKLLRSLELEDERSENKRWLISLKMIDELLNDFEFTDVLKLSLLTNLSDGFKAEFGFTLKGYKEQLDGKYRNNRKSIDEFMSGLSDMPDWYNPFSKILRHKSEEIQSIAKVLIEKEKNHELKIPLSCLLGSYIHMMINRLFRSEQRLSEMVIYDMLRRHYTSLIARTKYISSKESLGNKPVLKNFENR